jgi:hypothetical protein
MTKKKTKEDYIIMIFEAKYADDDDKYRDSNLAFLKSLTIEELKSMLIEEGEDSFPFPE